MYDRAKVIVNSGNGGNGCVAFHREKFVSAGGPDGGDGGRGGSVIFKADINVTDLIVFSYKREFKAENGGNGSTKKCSGKNGADIIIPVPVGTIIYDCSEDSCMVIADLDHPGQEIVAAMGGAGGLGNQHFASPTNQAPHLAQAGEMGVRKTVWLEMKIMADVAIIGFPNAGKSSLLKATTNADPKIAPYPFTTLSPKLGVVENTTERLILAEIPGLIKDAHQGKGLGHDFLRHIQRNRLLIHLVDASESDPLSAMIAVNNELNLYDPHILERPQLVVLNKVDLIDFERRQELQNIFKEAGVEISFISTMTKEGLDSLMEKVSGVLKEITASGNGGEQPTVMRPAERKNPALVVLVEGIYVIQSNSLERYVRGSDLSNGEARRQMRVLLTRKPLLEALSVAGAMPGDTVQCGTFIFKL